MIVRVGIPTPTGAIPRAVRERGYPVLVSASAFRRSGTQRGFRRPGLGLDGLDVALDSAGFVAMRLHGGYPWTVAEYLDLVAAWPWAWWASMDCCCEPEIAGDKATRLARIHETARLLGECRRQAADAGLSAPMPVLQGWEPDDYLMSAELMGDMPALVGVGSMCRRAVHGGLGILAILDLLDARLPAGVGLHLFGVKGDALTYLAQYPRVVSTDSMAWDFAARQRARRDGASCTIDRRLAEMDAWVSRQAAAVATRRSMQIGLPLSNRRGAGD